MLTLRCTQKLLRRLKTTPSKDVVRPTTRLGDWYANLLLVRRQQMILCVSERSLLPVVVEARDGMSFPDRLRTGLRAVLASLGVGAQSIAAELDAMRDVTFGRTLSRQTLGSMTDFARAIDYSDKPRSFVHLSLWLAEMPCGPLKMRSPDEVTVELMKVPRLSLVT